MIKKLDAVEESQRKVGLNEFHQFMIDCPSHLTQVADVKEVIVLFINLCENIEQQMAYGDKARMQKVLSETYQGKFIK